MHLELYSIFDNKMQNYKPPVPVRHVTEAIRGIIKAAENKETDIHKYPSDFSLYKVGVFDDTKGVIEPVIPPQHVSNLADIIGQKGA